jgi:hypothetical protein
MKNTKKYLISFMWVERGGAFDGGGWALLKNLLFPLLSPRVFLLFR